MKGALPRAWPLLLANVLAAGQVAGAQPPLDTGAVDLFVTAQMRAHGVPGMALAITHGDRVVYLRGYGTAGRGRETTPRTRFPLASLSKSFTALAVLQLAERTSNVLTSFDLAAEADDLAQGHLLAFGVPLASGEETGFLGGHAGVVSTAEDMARYLVMLASGGSYRGRRVVSPSTLASVLSPATGTGYAMGWFVTDRDGSPMLHHNGVLSTFAADAVLLPATRHGLVLLYDVHSLAHDHLAFPRVRDGLVALLLGEDPPGTGFTARHWGLAFAALTLIALALGVRGLASLPDWARWAAAAPPWRSVAGALLRLLPLAFLVTLPALVLRTSGRYFGPLTLYRSMVGVMTWLGVAALLGAVVAALRLGWLLRRG